MPLKLRLVVMGTIGFGAGLLMARLPFWAAIALLAAGAGWAVWQLVQVHRDLNRLKAELASIEAELNKEAGG